MPELPEVETMVRGIRPHVVGRRVAAVRKCRCACKPVSVSPAWPQMQKRAAGQQIVDVRRLAKRVVLELSSGEAFVVEPRMTGLMLLADPPDRGHLRIRWRFADKGEYPDLWFWDRRGLGTVRLSTAEELAVLERQSLGRDALSMSLADWTALCARTSRPVKVALLDQKLVAGIGNLYASEILHRAQVPPTQATRKLTPSQVARIAAATTEVLNEAIRYEGSTLSDGTYRNALNKSGGYQNEHRVYMRAGQPCRSCRSGVIERIVQAQRSTFYCPQCQR